MAPFPRGRAGFRAKGGQRGRGRGRGRGDAATGARKSSRFYSTRVEQSAESDTEASSADEGGEEKDNHELEEDTSSEGDEASETTSRPYNVLLQSLNLASESGLPARKRRRVERESSTIREIEEGSTSNVVGNPDDKEAVDAADEPEEEHSAVAEGSDEDLEDDGLEDASDPFELHFALPDENELSRNLRMMFENKWQPPNMATPLDWRPDLLTGREAIPGPQALKLKKKLLEPASKIFTPFSHTESILASEMFRYHDILFPDRSAANAKSLRRLTCLHVLNHILKTRHGVIKNNARLSKVSEDGDIELRDQGFTRPKVLMLLPTRQACVKVVDTITALFEPEQQENKKRFHDTFSRADEKSMDDKSEDFKELFGGNDDDMFRIGLKITRKTFKLFAQFYSSDIIFASPLGLRMAIGAEGAKKEDYDFLSSIEIVIVDHAGALLMQNWEHVEYIFQHLNLQPKEARGCDFSRVRNWYLDGHSRFLRQTIVFSAFNTPETNQLFTEYMRNVAGKVKFLPRDHGFIGDLGVDVKQTFSRYHSSSPSTDPDTRFKYFTTTIVPTLTRHVRSPGTGGQGILIFIPSYLDFVRVRNYFSDSAATQNISFGSISEYTSVREVARARSHFFSGRHAVLLYTERAHHFRRYRIRGVKKVIMYGLPDNPIFYRDIAGGYIAASVGDGLITSGEAAVRSVFCKWDLMKLQRIVGTTRVIGMLKEKAGDTFDFI